METSKIRITVLWVAVICGFALHTLADLLPLFWDESITIEATGNAPVGLLTFMMTVSYLIPVIGVLCTSYWVKRYWIGMIKMWNITMPSVWQWTVCCAVSKLSIRQSVSTVYAIFSKTRNGRCAKSSRYLNNSKPSTIR